MEDLELLSKRDTYSIVTALLYLIKDEPKYSTLSELFYILDKENFTRLIQYYGGKEIRIPTITEINDMLKVLLLYQYYKVEEIEWTESLKMAGYKPDEGLKARNYLNSLSKILKNFNVKRD